MYDSIVKNWGQEVSQEDVELEVNNSMTFIDLEEEESRQILNKVFKIGKHGLSCNLYLKSLGILSKKNSKSILKKISNIPMVSFWLSLDNYCYSKASFLVPDLWRILPNWIVEMKLENLVLSRRDWQLIFNSSLDWENWTLSSWKLNFEDITITNKYRSNIDSIDLNYCGSG